MAQVKNLSNIAKEKYINFAQSWMGADIPIDSILSWDLNSCMSTYNSSGHPSCFLHFAIKEDEVELVDELCELGVNVNQVDDNIGKTPLQVACDYGRHSIVKALIEYGAQKAEVSLNYKMSQPLTFVWCIKEAFMARNADYNEVEAAMNGKNCKPY